MKMKDLSRAILGMAVLFSGLTTAADASARPEDALGQWATPSKHGVVEIAACGTAICGHLRESDAIRANPDARDTHNSDAALRSRKLQGVTMLAGFVRADNGWTGGTIYNPEDGHTYHATMTITGPTTLVVRGCIVWPLCKSQTWQRLR
jgi:uncharacterized protein (DUF2147 family)